MSEMLRIGCVAERGGAPVAGSSFSVQKYNFFMKEKNILRRIFQQFFGWIVDKFCNLRSIKEIGIFLPKVKGKKTKKR